MTTITSLPTPPSRNDPGTFSSRTDALLGALPTFVAETNAIAGEVNANAATATTQAGVATTQAGIAAAEAAAAVATAANVAAIAGAAAWVSGNTYAYPDTAISPATFQTYRKKTASSVTTTDPSADSTNWEPVSTGGVGLLRDARTSNVKLSAAELGRFIDITSGSFTQTFDSAATLGEGWFCYLRNSGTGDVTLEPNASDTIDGLTSFIMYPGEVRLLLSDGTALRSVVLNSFRKVFTTSGTFTKPPGYSVFDIVSKAGGGGGGGGAFSTATPSVTAGGGGGGGSILKTQIEAINVPDGMYNVIVGSGGVGGTAGIDTGTQTGESGSSGGHTYIQTIENTFSNGGNGGTGGGINAGGGGGSGGAAGGKVSSGSYVSGSGGNRGISGGPSDFGGGGGGGGKTNGLGAGSPGGMSAFAGNGGKGGDYLTSGFANGANATITSYGGAGGSSLLNSSGGTAGAGGAGARGEFSIWGII